MKIRSVRSDPRRRAFLVRTARGVYEFPWTQLDVVPSAADPVVAVYPDPELAREAFTYRLASGAEDAVPLDQVRWFVRDPDYLREELLFTLTAEALEAVRTSGRSKRSLARQLGTSLAQIARLLDTTNYRKSVDQMVRLLGSLGCRLEPRIVKARVSRAG